MEIEMIEESGLKPGAKVKPAKKPKDDAKVKSTGSASVKKLDVETMRLLVLVRERVNKKNFGRRIRDSEILAIALKSISADQIKALQESSYTEKDRLNMAHEDYVRGHGKISMDEFIGRLLRGELTIKK